jgi:hypothetical protein
MVEVTEFSPFVWGMRAPSDDDVQRPQDQAEDHSGSDSLSDRAKTRPPKSWTLERLRKIIQRESTEWIGVRFNISVWRDTVIAIGRRFLRDIFKDDDTLDGNGGDDFDEDNEEGDSPWDLQCSHGTYVAGDIYTRLITEGKFETMSKRE